VQTDERDGFEVVGIHHVQLAMPPGREEDADAFYSRVLRLTRVPKPEALAGRGGCWFRGSGVEVHLGVEEDFRPARKAHPALRVRGLPGLRRRLEDAGAVITEEPPLEGWTRLHTADPFGNRIELIEAVTPAAEGA
jgi:catechol 2,3-dioxygenase-like lactoylglutathione lyase family enzyme